MADRPAPRMLPSEFREALDGFDRLIDNAELVLAKIRHDRADFIRKYRIDPSGTTYCSDLDLDDE